MGLFRVALFVFCVFSSVLWEQTRLAAAPSFSVGQLHKHCVSYLKLIKKPQKRPLTKAQAVDIVKCNVFIAGFHFGKTGANTLNDTLGPYCLPHGEKTTTNWLIRNFVRWAAKHPHQRNKVAGLGLMRSLLERYACDERDRVK